MRESAYDPSRRAFLGQLGLVAAVGTHAGRLLPMVDSSAPRPQSAWDMSWTEAVAKARYKAVFDSPSLADGAALDVAADIWGSYKDVYGTDDDVRMVVVMRQLGQVMAFNDHLWEKYGIGAERNVKDPVTQQPARRNVYLTSRAGDPDYAVSARLDSLHKRGAIFLVCNRASMNWAASAATRTGTPVETVREDVRANLVPGAVLMPTGVFALARAQNAGCAYMKGS